MITERSSGQIGSLQSPRRDDQVTECEDCELMFVGDGLSIYCPKCKRMVSVRDAGELFVQRVLNMLEGRDPTAEV